MSSKRTFGGTRGYGYTPDPDGHQVTSIRQLVGRNPRMKYAALPASVDWLGHLLGSAFDQGPTSSCFGHGQSGALYGAFSLIEQPLDFIPSPKGIYDIARCVDRDYDEAGSALPLTDTGASANQGVRALPEWGIMPMGPLAVDGRFSDVNPARDPGDDDMSYVAVNDEPSFLDLEEARECRVQGPYRIDSTIKSQIVEDTCLCLANKILVPAGIFVDYALEEWNPAKGALGRPNFNDPDGGWHWIFFYGYDTLSSGKRVFKWRNSWGDWGRDGNGLGDEDFLAASVDRHAMVVRRVS